jgi:chaperonin GroES
MTDAISLPNPRFKPLRDRILVVRDEAEKQTEGGIIVPQSIQKPPSQGIVIAVGPGQHTESGVLIPLDLHRGDRVAFGAHAGHDIEIDDVAYIVITANDVLGVL